MNTQEIIWLQRQREADHDTMAHALNQVQIASKRMDKQKSKLQDIIRAARRATSDKNKVKLLREMAGIVMDAFKGLIPCKDGCSHCCHIPTLVTREEAAVIAEETGRPMRLPAQFSTRGNMAYFGTPCPFLKNDRCSIYKSRPVVCRLHVTVDRDDLLCNVASVTQMPQWDSSMFHMAEIEAFYGSGSEPALADIRDFFQTQT